MSIEPTLKRKTVGEPLDKVVHQGPDVRGKARDLRIQCLHHHAFYCRNSEETRKFYEEVLELPLTMTVVLHDDILFGKGEYCHIFFEIADGSSIAFFEYPALWAERGEKALNEFEHHLAFKVADIGVLEYYRDRLQAHGVESRLIDHEVYQSLYFNDPNGLNFELLTETAITAAVEARGRETAHADLAAWMRRRDAVAANG